MATRGEASPAPGPPPSQLTQDRLPSCPPVIPSSLYSAPGPQGLSSLLQAGGHVAARTALRAFAGVAVCQGSSSAGAGPGAPGVQRAQGAASEGQGWAAKGGALSVAGGIGPPFMGAALCQGAGGAIQSAESLAARAAGEAAGHSLGHQGHTMGHHIPPASSAHPGPASAQPPNSPHPHPHPNHHHHHDPPPNSTLGFAEDATVHEEEEKLKPAPRLTATSIAKSLVAGGVAGGVSRTAVAPLERLKILQQVQSGQGGAQYQGMWHGLRRIWQQEGFHGLFRGNGVNCARIVPNSAVKFFAYEEASQGLLWLLRTRTNDPDAELTPLLRLGAGATAGIIAMSATYPMDMVRGRLTVQADGAKKQYRNMGHAMTTVWREEGPRALYRGWLPSVIGVVPYVGLNFAVYETLKDWLAKHYNKERRQLLREGGASAQEAAAAPPVELSVVTKLACGAVAGTMGQTVAYPLDVVRRRLQMVGWKNAAPVLTAGGQLAAAPQYSGMVDAFRKTVQAEGVGALFRGLLPNSVKVVPSIAIAFVTYEVMKDMLGVEIRISD